MAALGWLMDLDFAGSPAPEFPDPIIIVFTTETLEGPEMVDEVLLGAS